PIVLGGAFLFDGTGMAQVGAPVNVSGLRLGSTPGAQQNPPRILKSTGQVQLVVRLSSPPLVAQMGLNAKRAGSAMTPAQQRSYVAQLAQQQNSLANQIRALGGQELARLSKASNALIVSIDAAQVDAVSRLTGVARIRPVVDYSLALSTTVPYIGAK